MQVRGTKCVEAKRGHLGDSAVAGSVFQIIIAFRFFACSYFHFFLCPVLVVFSFFQKTLVSFFDVFSCSFLLHLGDSADAGDGLGN